MTDADIFDEFLEKILQQPKRFIARDSEAHESALNMAKKLFQMGI